MEQRFDCAFGGGLRQLLPVDARLEAIDQLGARFSVENDPELGLARFPGMLVGVSVVWVHLDR